MIPAILFGVDGGEILTRTSKAMTCCLNSGILMLLVLNFMLPSFAVPAASVPLSIKGQASTAQGADFGSISALHPAPISRTFVLSNSDSHSMTVSDLRPACGCTSALTARNAALPLVLLPGQQITVQVTLDPANLPPGPVSKLVWVYIQGRRTPAATLELKGILVPPVQLSATVLDYEHAAAGVSTSRILTMTWNPATLPAGVVPRLISTDPDVQVRPQETEEAALPTTSGPQTRTYTCLLAPQARLGALDGAVEAVFTDPRSGTVILGSVPLRGDVVGDVAATPSIIAFGSAPSGLSTTRQVLLTLTKPQRLTVSSSSRFVTAQLGSAQTVPASRPFPGGTANAAISLTPAVPRTALPLNITLKPTAPPGPLEAEVIVTTAGGQRLRLPVFAVVTPPQVKP